MLRQAGEPLPLTDREREIVLLIGEGLSSREVAQRLTLSVRTVESHVYRAMSRPAPPAATNSPPCYPAPGREHSEGPDAVRLAPVMISVSPY